MTSASQAESTSQPASASHATTATVAASKYWIMDSGASHHMTSHRDWFQTYYPFQTPLPIELGNNAVIHAQGKGTIKMQLDVYGKSISDNTLTDVLYAPELGKNLFSIWRAMKHGLSVHFKNERAAIVDDSTHKAVMTASPHNSLFHVNGDVIVPSGTASVASTLETAAPKMAFATATSAIDTMTLWHRRLGHIGESSIHTMINQNSVTGLSLTKTNLNFCEDCAANKLTRTSFPSKGQHATSKLEIVHSDICGPMKVSTFQGNRYFVTFIDDYSRYAHVYFIKHKSQAFDMFQDYKAAVENAAGTKIKTLRTDRGGEYMGKDFINYLRRYGIRHQLTTPFTPEQNGVAERFNRTVVEMARTMLHSAKLSYSFWAEAVHTATYLRNRCITHAIDDGITPYELWSGKKPDISHLRIFGCDAFALNHQHDHKFASKATKCIFIGYSLDSKGYRLWDPQRRRLIISRDVKFNEAIDYVTVSAVITTQTTAPPLIAENIESPPTTVNPEMPISESPKPSDITDSTLHFNPHLTPASPNQSHYETQHNVEDTSNSESSNSKPTSTPRARQHQQLHSDLGPYWSTPSSRRRTSTQDVNNNFAYAEDDEFAFAYIAETTFAEPRTYGEAMQSTDSKKWKATMDEEYESLISNHTWDLVPYHLTKQQLTRNGFTR